MTSHLRSRHSRSPRGPNDIQYQLAQFPCGTHNPLERERVCREIQTEDIDFGDPHIACKERVIPENWQSAHQRTNEARQAHPIRECLFTKDPRSSVPSTDLTTAQMFIQGTAYPEHLPEIHHPDYLTPPTFITALKIENHMISSRTFEMYVLLYMTGAQESFGYSTKA